MQQQFNQAREDKKHELEIRNKEIKGLKQEVVNLNDQSSYISCLYQQELDEKQKMQTENSLLQQEVESLKDKVEETKNFD